MEELERVVVDERLMARRNRSLSAIVASCWLFGLWFDCWLSSWLSCRDKVDLRVVLVI